MGIRDGVRQRTAQALRGTRSHRLRLACRQPPRIRNLGSDCQIRTGEDAPWRATPPEHEQEQAASGQQNGGNHREGAGPVEPQRAEGWLWSRRPHAIRDDARDVERRSPAGQGVRGTVGTEAPQRRHIQVDLARRPGDDCVAHDPPARSRQHHRIAKRLRDGRRRELAHADAPAGGRRDRALELNRVADGRLTRCGDPAVCLDNEQQERWCDHRLSRRARSANARRSGTA